MVQGIDISRWQGSDFDISRAIKEHDIGFAIIKIGGGDGELYKDSQSERYYKQACAAGIAKGFYFFGNAGTVEEAKNEATYCIRLLQGKRFEYPIFYDVESKNMMKQSKRRLTDIIKTFCETMEQAGFWVGIYSSTSVYETKVYDKELLPYSHWVADWRGNKPELSSGAEVQIWQTGSTKNWQGNKEVDNDICYVSYYEEAVKRKGLNGYGAPKKSVHQIAKEVWAGIWGNGEYRKKILTKMGYDYRAVQDEVNRLKKGVKK